MEANIHTSKFDSDYSSMKSNILAQLEIEFYPKIEEALDKNFVKLEISIEISDRIHKLSSNHHHDITNLYKKALLDTIEKYLKRHKENPIDHFISIEVPKLKAQHLEWMGRSTHSYSFDKKFIHAKPNQIVALISESKALLDYRNSLFPSSQLHGKLIDSIELIAPTDKIQISIEILYKHLYPKAINVPFDEFSLHFKSENIPIKIKWELAEVLIVLLFDGLQKEKLISKSNIFNLISNHFINKKNKDYKPKQLEISYQNSAKQKTRNLDIVTQTIAGIKNLT